MTRDREPITGDDGRVWHDPQPAGGMMESFGPDPELPALLDAAGNRIEPEPEPPRRIGFVLPDDHGVE